MAKVKIRCFFFDQEGRRVRQHSNHKEDCRFIHPDDPEWPTAPMSRFHPRAPGPASAASYPHRRDHSRSRSPRRSHGPRPRSRSRSPSRRRMSTSDPRLDSSRAFSTRRAADSAISHSPVPLRQPAPAPAPAPAPPPALVPPPLPRSLPSPPPLPPALAAANASATPQPATKEDMKVMWDKVLPLMANSVAAQKAHQEAQSNLNSFERMLRASRFATLTPADRERVDRQHADLKATLDDKNREVNNALGLLKATNWWPVGPNQDESAADKYRELIQFAANLNSTTTEMYQLYKKVHSTVTGDSTAFETADVPQDANARPLKRRRMSVDDAPLPDPADTAELSKMQDTLDRFEGRLCDLEDQFTRLSQADPLEPIEADPASTEADPASTSINPALKQVTDDIEKLDADMIKMNEELAPLVAKSGNLRVQTENLEKARQKDTEEIAAMQQRLEAYEEASRRDQESMMALSRAFELLQQQRPPPPPSLPLGFILSEIDEPIRNQVRSVVRPMVDKMAKDVAEQIDKQDEKTYGQLWGKIALTLRVVDVVSKVTHGRTPEPYRS